MAASVGPPAGLCSTTPMRSRRDGAGATVPIAGTLTGGRAASNAVQNVTVSRTERVTTDWETIGMGMVDE